MTASSSSLSWLIGEFFISLVAISGGLLVFRGLWLEKEADEAEKKEHADAFVDQIKSLKLKSKRGWKMLMWGVALETVVAGVFAARDGWEIRQMKNYEVSIDPLNRPILDISATVKFSINKADFSELPPFGNLRRTADLWLMEPPSPNIIALNGGRLNERLWDLMGPSELPILDTDHSFSFSEKTGQRTYFMQFHFDEDWAFFDLNRMEKKVNELNNVNVLRISVKCLPHNLEILDGSVKLVINNSVVKIFQIPKQEDNRYGDPIDTYSNTTPFVILAYLTNSSTADVSH
jgi:hypothetical protein